MCLLSTFAVILGAEVRQKYALIMRLNERDALSFVAEAGVKKAIIELKNSPEQAYTALKDAWSNNSVVFRDMIISDALVNISYEYTDDPGGESTTRYGLTDEESKININTADQKALERLFNIVLNKGVEQARELAVAIVDWRGNEVGQTSAPNPAVDSYYRGLQYSYHSKNKKFEVLEELLLVRGFDQDIFSALRNYITIYGSGRVNINTASRVVLVAVGLSARAAEAVMALRCGADKISGTTDDGVFDTVEGIVPRLGQYAQLSKLDIESLTSVAGAYLSTHSEYFMVHCEAKLKGRKNVSLVNCVVNRSGTIVYWREL